MTARKTNDQFISELKQINDQIITEEDYIKSSEPIACFCKKCGYRWKARPNSLLRGFGCPSCAGNVIKTDEEFRTELSSINPDIEVLGSYEGNKKPILCKCRKCGHRWNPAPNNLLTKGQGCPKCSRKRRGIKRRKTNDDFLRELAEVNPTVKPLEEYKTGQKRIKCQCLRCGHIWSATPNNLLDKGSRCPNCSHASTSVIEQILLLSFSEALGEEGVISRDKKAIGSELDIYMPTYNFAIEYGAWYWHRNRLQKDKIKQQKCEEKGIRLVTIYEDCPAEMIDETTTDCRFYAENISNEDDYHTIKAVIKEFCDELDIPFEGIAARWESITEKALNNSQKRTDQDFYEMVKVVNPTVKLIEAYRRSNEKIKCRCLNCGHEWMGLPTSLLRGHACPKCARKTTGEKRTITNEEFLDRLAENNPNIEPLDKYIKGDIPIRCKCKVCGRVWSVKPSNLLQGNGCVKCNRQRVAEAQGHAVRCIETGEEYYSIAEACRAVGTGEVYKCLRGIKETAAGYHWEYVN